MSDTRRLLFTTAQLEHSPEFGDRECIAAAAIAYDAACSVVASTPPGAGIFFWFPSNNKMRRIVSLWRRAPAVPGSCWHERGGIHALTDMAVCIGMPDPLADAAKRIPTDVAAATASLQGSMADGKLTVVFAVLRDSMSEGLNLGSLQTSTGDFSHFTTFHTCTILI